MNKYKVKTFDQILGIGFTTLIALYVIVGYFAASTMQTYIAKEFSDSYIRGAEAIGSAVTPELGRGNYRVAWQMIDAARDQLGVIHFRLLDQDGNDLVGDIESAMAFADLKNETAELFLGISERKSFWNKQSQTFETTIRLGKHGNRIPFQIQFLFDFGAISRIGYILQAATWFTAFLISCLSLVVFMQLKKRFRASFQEFQDTALSVLKGHELVLNIDSKNDYFNVLEAASSFQSEYKKACSELERKSQYEAIAHMTQALAHDVRRPFSMVKAVMQAVEASPDINLARELLKLSIPEINQAMASVEGMVQDIMQIGTEAKPVLETVCPKQIILNALKELFRVYPDADVSIESDFRNTGYISIDTTRFSRVFSNILGNALQAMQGKGTLWFKTSNFEDRVLFRIGNSGSIIPQENLAKLFDAFFTS